MRSTPFLLAAGAVVSVMLGACVPETPTPETPIPEPSWPEEASSVSSSASSARSSAIPKSAPRVPAYDGRLQVQWHEPRKVDVRQFLTEMGRWDDLLRGYADRQREWYPEFQMTDAEIAERITKDQQLILHQVGTLGSGPYVGGAVYLLREQCFVGEGMCSPTYYRIIRTADKSQIVVLTKYSTGDMQEFAKMLPLIVDESATMDVYAPEQVSIPNKSYPLRLSSRQFEFFSERKKTFAYHDAEVGDVFFDELTNCLAVANKDGTFTLYEIDFPFLVDETKYTPGEKPRTTPNLDAVWNDGTRNTRSYVSALLNSCGVQGCYSVVNVRDGKIYEQLYSDGATQAQKGYALEEVGRTPDDTRLYREVYSQADLQAFPKDYNNIRYLHQVYQMFYAEKKPTVTAFYAQYPVLYFQDPFGRWIRLTNEKFIPAVECGKPVIYLYPEQEQKVSVRVFPGGGITVSDPPYGEGWTVTASPDGTLVNHGDEKTYGSLFWEGIGLDYRMPDEAFVVQRADVEKTLRTALAAQGLQGREIEEFLAFWLPRMQEKPWYMIGFTPQQRFDQIAPLAVTPKPDTVIRVFMDYRGLDQPIEATPPTLSTPARKGFTVVEWGGALH